jgi:sugar phosphate isomerase/epimerase
MNIVSRRRFLAQSIASLPVLTALASEVRAGSGKGFLVGSQSYSYRHFSFEDSIKKLRETGLVRMEFCAAHFPPDACHEGFEKVKSTIRKAGIHVPCYGVEGFTADEAANRKKFEFAKALGIEILTANPEPESFDSLDKLTKEFDVKIAIHNHGPDAMYDKVADTLKAVEGRNALIGACVDTGHVIRSGEKPHEVVRALGKRVHSLHLKDWRHGGEEQIVGEGDLDLLELVKALNETGFQGPISLEYENNPENPVPDMKKGLSNWLRAVAKV